MKRVDVVLKFYTDTHIAKAVAVQLRTQGVDIVRCEEVGMAEADDDVHLVYATKEGRILVSQDDDFARLHAEWQQAGRSHGGIMKVSKLRGATQISHVVNELLFYIEAERAGAVDYAAEIANHILYI